MKIMVLNDGETYTNLDGCMIVDIPDDYDMEGIEQELKAIHNGPFQMNPDGPTRIFSFPESKDDGLVHILKTRTGQCYLSYGYEKIDQ